MADSAADIRARYPIPVFYYEVNIDGMDPIAFQEVSGLSMEYELITYKDGLSYKEGIKFMPGQRSAVKLSLKKGVIRGDSKLFDWFSTIKLNTVDKKDLTVTLKDESDSPVVVWKVKNAFPTKMDAPSFNAGTNDVAVESLDLTANFLSVEHL